jgi:5-methylcytosine-specific restriction endonuclease McrA
MSEASIRNCLEFMDSIDEVVTFIESIGGGLDEICKDIAVDAMKTMRRDYDEGTFATEPHPDSAERHALMLNALKEQEKIDRITGYASEIGLAVSKLETVKAKAGEAITGIVEAGMGCALDAENSAAKERATVIDLQDRLKRRGEHFLHKAEVRQAVWDITGGSCIYCKVELTRERTEEEPHRCFHVDHIVPKASGGPDHLSNYVPACHRCNVSKGAKSYIEFIRLIESRSQQLEIQVPVEAAE